MKFCGFFLKYYRKFLAFFSGVFKKSFIPFCDITKYENLDSLFANQVSCSSGMTHKFNCGNNIDTTNCHFRLALNRDGTGLDRESIFGSNLHATKWHHDEN